MNKTRHSKTNKQKQTKTNKKTRHSSSMAASLNGHPLEAERHIFSLKRSSRLEGSSLDSHPRPDSSKGKRRMAGVGPEARPRSYSHCSHCGPNCGLQSLHLPMKIIANASVNKRSLFSCFPRNFPTKKLNVKWICGVSILIWQWGADTKERTILSHPLFPPPRVLVR